nr:hypothetical protein [uncultured Actinoplanes sp.]
MIVDRSLARGGLSYVDRLDFTRGSSLTVAKRMPWPSVRLVAGEDSVTFSSRAGADTLRRAEVTAVPHRPLYGRFGLPAAAVSFEVEGRDQVLLFWTPRVAAVIRELARRGWDAVDPGPPEF